MSLFDDCTLPDDERAQEILMRISELWDDNAGVRNICSELHPNPNIRHEKVSMELMEELINLSMTFPQALEDMLNEEVSLHNILRFVAREAVD